MLLSNVMSKGKTVTANDLPLNIKDRTLKARYAALAKDALPSAIEDIEKTKILDALKRTGWVQSKAARLLGITSRQIGYKIKKYSIQEAG